MAGTSQRCAGRPRQTTRSDARSAAAYAAPRPAVAAPIASGASGAQVGWTAAGGGADAVSWAALLPPRTVRSSAFGGWTRRLGV